jgi:cyclophilin family peptidyl-prolyl cis-trans isomerase
MHDAYCHSLLLCALCACGNAPPTTERAPAPPAQGTRSSPRARLLADADARSLSEWLRRAALDAAPDVRADAVLGMARLHDPDAFDALARALRDPTPAPRQAAALGIGALEDRAPDGASAAMLGALAAERDPSLRGRLLEDMGRLATDEVVAAVPAALASDHPEERRGACRGLANVALRGRSLGSDALRRISSRLLDDSSPAVRLACAFALSRAAPPEDIEVLVAIGDDLVRAASDPDSDVRAMAYRALGRYPGGTTEQIAAGASDPDWPVAVHAMRTLANRAQADRDARELAGALEAALQRVTAEGDVAAGGPLHVLLAGLDAAAPVAGDPALRTFAERAHQRLGRLPDGVPPTRDRGLAHCATARLVDLGRQRAERVLTCGVEQVSEVEQRVLEAGIHQHLGGTEPQRTTAIRRLLRDASPIVRQAALAAAGAVEHPELRAAVIDAVRADTDIGARIAALEALRAISARRSSRLASALFSGTDPDDDWPHQRVVAAMRSALDAMIAADHLEGLVSWLAAARDVASRDLAPLAVRLAAHPNLAVRLAAISLATEAGAELPAAAPARPSNPIAAEALDALVPGRAVVDTDRGRFVIELLAEEAPTTTIRFGELVRAQFFDGLSFHRVVPGFVVQGGDPRGDGYGGPPWSQRCEDHRVPYERGTVGMALAGRDTGGSQFFVTVAPQPHLDARYTAFGRVVEGMEVVDRLQAGDHIRSIRLENPPPSDMTQP